MPFAWKTSCGEYREAHAWRRTDAAGVLACLHGLSGSGEQFAPVGEAMAPLSVYALELRGQGCDPVVARRSMVLDIPAQHRDIKDFLAAIRAEHPGEPIYLFGESMGSLLSASFAAHHDHPDVAGLILSVPVVELVQPVPGWLRAGVRALGKSFPTLKFFPSWFVSGKSVAPPLTRDRAYQDAMRSAPWHIRIFTLRFLSELGDLIMSSPELAPRVRKPVLVLAAGNDCFVKVAQIERWFASLGSEDKTLHVYGDSYHLLWHDLDCDRVLADVAKWVGDRKDSPLPDQPEHQR